jgi:RHS repeat-associated protein
MRYVVCVCAVLIILTGCSKNLVGEKSMQVVDDTYQLPTDKSSAPSQTPEFLSTIQSTNSRIVSFYIYANGNRIARKENNVLSYYHTDQLGSVRAINTDTGAVLERQDYTPYGADLHGSKLNNEFAYTGQYDDGDLYYYGARYMDPITSRFTQADPLGSAASSQYAYVNNNPMNSIDPTGMAPVMLPMGFPARSWNEWKGSARRFFRFTQGVMQYATIFNMAGQGSVVQREGDMIDPDVQAGAKLGAALAILGGVRSIGSISSAPALATNEGAIMVGAVESEASGAAAAGAIFAINRGGVKVYEPNHDPKADELSYEDFTDATPDDRGAHYPEYNNFGPKLGFGWDPIAKHLRKVNPKLMGEIDAGRAEMAQVEAQTGRHWYLQPNNPQVRAYNQKLYDAYRTGRKLGYSDADLFK